MARTGRAFPSHQAARQKVLAVTEAVTYTYTSTGGITFSGTATIARTFGDNVSTGGIVFGGSASVTRTLAVSSSGGIVFGGSATVTRAWLRTSTGGIIFAGSADVHLVRVHTSTGGIVFSGSANVTLILTTPTVAQVEGATRNEIFKRFLRETGLGSYGVVTGVSGGATVTLDDTTRLKSSQFKIGRAHV